MGLPIRNTKFIPTTVGTTKDIPGYIINMLWKTGVSNEISYGTGQYSGGDQQYSQPDYAENLNEESAKSLLQDNRFIQDIYDYYGTRDGKTFNGGKEAVEYFLNDRRWRNNTVAIGKDVYAHNQSKDHQ